MSVKNRRPRPSRTAVTHRRDREVLAAAGKVFYERGYADATVQDVADELSILKGSLYHYIDNKEDLLFRLFHEIHDDGADQILDVVEDAVGLTGLERLALFIRLQVEFNLDHQMRIAVYHNDFDRLGPERRTELLRRRRRHEGMLIDLLVEVEGETGLDLHPSTTSKLAYGAFIWTYRWYDESGPLDRAELVNLCTAFVLRGILGYVPTGLREPGAAAPDQSAS